MTVISSTCLEITLLRVKLMAREKRWRDEDGNRRVAVSRREKESRARCHGDQEVTSLFPKHRYRRRKSPISGKV